MVRAWSKINSPKYQKIVCSISGGSDSDVMLDIVWRCDKDNKVTYVWFDTGLEYQATKDHLKYLENKYNIENFEYVESGITLDVNLEEEDYNIYKEYILEK